MTGRLAETLPAPCAEALERLATIPGSNGAAAQHLLAEIGTDREQFGSAARWAWGTGLCPGTNESAGKRQSGKTPQGQRWLRAPMGQVAWAASHPKDPDWSAPYRRLAARRGKKQARVALGHTLRGISAHVLQDQTTYRALGPDYFDPLATARWTRSSGRRGERLGHPVTLHPQQPAA